MNHPIPLLYLPMADGTLSVFCHASYRKRMPCAGRVNLDKDGTLIKGTLVYDADRKPLYFCGHHCLAWYVKGA